MSDERLKQAARVLLERKQAREHFIHFLYLKWLKFDNKPFYHNWHFQYLSEILTATLPTQAKEKELPLLKRIMLNMPPSYGKTEIVARSFIPYALGIDRSRKFIYISYSDDLCKKISNEIRVLLKSPFWKMIFKKSPEFIQDNTNEFILKEGGGCFFTTLKSAITGFHANCIIVDDPIKVSDMNSRSAREAVNKNFSGSVLSRLKDEESSVIIIMQRLGDDDLCGYLLNPKIQDEISINQWYKIQLKALNKDSEQITFGHFNYMREANEPLFNDRHNSEELQRLRLEIGEDNFSTQMQQEPIARESGFFDLSHFSPLPAYEISEFNTYILIDTAESLQANADDRAIIVIGVENYNNLPRYCVFDCESGIYDEEILCEKIISFFVKYPKAKAFIEATGGGLIVERILNKKVLQANETLKAKGRAIISNEFKTYPTFKKISKMQKISALKSYLNTGHLRYLNSASGIDKIKAQLNAFNPEKKHYKNDCIDALSSCVALDECTMPFIIKRQETYNQGIRFTERPLKWRI